MTENFISKWQGARYRYHLACLILSGIDGFSITQLEKDIKNANDFLNKWLLKSEDKEKDVKP